MKLGDTHSLECRVSSSQSLNICWYKNDQKISDGANAKLTFEALSARLQLLSAVFEDSGIYTCEVHNDAGSTSCSSVLTVQGQLSGDSSMVPQKDHMQHERQLRLSSNRVTMFSRGSILCENSEPLRGHQGEGRQPAL